MLKKIMISALILVCSSSAFAGEWTGVQQVNLIDTSGATQDFTIIPVGNAWGAAGCPSAAYVVISSSLASYKELLASTLTAKAAGLSVRFFGDCAANPAFFVGTKLRLQ